MLCNKLTEQNEKLQQPRDKDVYTFTIHPRIINKKMALSQDNLLDTNHYHSKSGIVHKYIAPSVF